MENRDWWKSEPNLAKRRPSSSIIVLISNFIVDLHLNLINGKCFI